MLENVYAAFDESTCACVLVHVLYDPNVLQTKHDFGMNESRTI